jgi:hypothetical protein
MDQFIVDCAKLNQVIREGLPSKTSWFKVNFDMLVN